MTAAHCLWKYKSSEYIVRTGDFNNEVKININQELNHCMLDSLQEKDPFEKQWKIETMKLHPGFDKGTLFNNDIALIKIKRKKGQGIK